MIDPLAQNPLLNNPTEDEPEIILDRDQNISVSIVQMSNTNWVGLFVWTEDSFTL